MRKVTQVTAQALKNQTPLTMGNTSVMGGDGNTILTLHGNVIATVEGNKLLLTSSGWETNTTKERLNGILETFGLSARVAQRDFEWFIVDGDNATKFKAINTFRI